MADYWIKLYQEIIDDPKMATLPDRLWRRTIEVFLLAGRLSKERSGILPDTRQLAWALRMNTDDLQADLEQLAMTGIVKQIPGGWAVTNFNKRQSAVPSTERVKQHRKRIQKQEYYGDETQMKRKVTEILDTDTDTEEEEMKTHPHAALSVAFVNETQIPELTGGPQKWFQALEKLGVAGVEPDDIVTAIKELRDKRYSIVSLSSVVNAAISTMSKRKAGSSSAGITKSELARLGYDHRGS